MRIITKVCVREKEKKISLMSQIAARKGKRKREKEKCLTGRERERGKDTEKVNSSSGLQFLCPRVVTSGRHLNNKIEFESEGGQVMRERNETRGKRSFSGREREQLFFGKVPCSFPFFLSFPGQAQKLKLARTQLLRPFFFLSLKPGKKKEEAQLRNSSASVAISCLQPPSSLSLVSKSASTPLHLAPLL